MLATLGGFLALLLGLGLLLLPLLFSELSRPRDSAWGALVLLLGLVLVTSADRLTGAPMLAVLCGGLLIGRLGSEVAQARWRALTDEERLLLRSAERWSRSLHQLGAVAASLLQGVVAVLASLSAWVAERRQVRPRGKRWVRAETESGASTEAGNPQALVAPAGSDAPGEPAAPEAAEPAAGAEAGAAAEAVPVTPADPAAAASAGGTVEALEPQAREPQAPDPAAEQGEAMEPEPMEPEATEPEATEPEVRELEAPASEAPQLDAVALEVEAVELQAVELETVEPQAVGLEVVEGAPEPTPGPIAARPEPVAGEAADSGPGPGAEVSLPQAAADADPMVAPTEAAADADPTLARASEVLPPEAAAAGPAAAAEAGAIWVEDFGAIDALLDQAEPAEDRDRAPDAAAVEPLEPGADKTAPSD